MAQGFFAIIGLSVLMTTLGRTAQVLWWSVLSVEGCLSHHPPALRILAHLPRRHGARSSLARAEVGMLYSGTAFPYLLNLSQGWAHLTPWGTQCFQIPVPAVLAWGALGVFIACSVQVFWGWWLSFRSGQLGGWQRLMHFGSAISVTSGLDCFGRDRPTPHSQRSSSPVTMTFSITA